MRLEEQQLGRRDRLERARDAGAARELARLDGRLVGDAVVGVERVLRGVREDDLRLELADQVGEPLDRGGVHHERIVAEIEGAEAGPERGCRGLRLRVADLLDALLGLPGLLPELARLAALAVRERDDVRRPPVRDDRRDRTGGAPDEVGGVRADDEEAPRHRRASACSRPPSYGSRPRANPASSRRVGHQREPVLDRWVRHLAEIGREDVALRARRADRGERLLPRDLAGVDRREAPLEHRAPVGKLDLLVDRDALRRIVRDA